jgi:hypothetical protein
LSDFIVAGEPYASFGSHVFEYLVKHVHAGGPDADPVVEADHDYPPAAFAFGVELVKLRLQERVRPAGALLQPAGDLRRRLAGDQRAPDKMTNSGLGVG